MSTSPSNHVPQAFDGSIRILLGLGIVLGLGMILLVPPFTAGDEWNHFLRAYELSEGKLLAHRENGSNSNVGDEGPSSLLKTLKLLHAEVLDDREINPSLNKIWAALHLPLEPEDRHFHRFPNTALYSPVPYGASAAAIAIARWAGASPLMMFYCGRAANLAAFLFLVCLSLRLTPILRTSFALMALLPMSLSLACSLSADGMTLGLTMLSLAATLRVALHSTAVTGKNLAGLVVLFSLMALCKQAYTPLILMFFIIPIHKCGGRQRYIAAAALVIAVPIVFNLVWARMVTPIYYPMYAQADPVAHLQYTLSRPLSYSAEMIYATCDRFLWINMPGILCRQSILLPETVLEVLWISLAASVVLDGTGQYALAARSRCLLLGICLLGLASIITFVNLSTQSAGVKGIVCLQSRYFLPLLPLLMAVFRIDCKLPFMRTIGRLQPLAIIAVALLGSITSWVVLFQHFYLHES